MATSPTAATTGANQGTVPTVPLAVQNAMADQINKAIRQARPNSPLADQGESFVRWGRAYNVDPRFLVGIAFAETELGTTGGAASIHNPFGLGPGFRYPSWDAAIRFAASNIAGRLYYGRGAYTVEDISHIWAPIGAANDPNNTNVNHVPNIVAAINRMFDAGYTPTSDVRVLAQTNGSFLDSIPGASAVTGAIDATTSGLSTIANVLKFLADPQLWLRIGEMIIGIIGMVLGALFAVRGQGSSAKPIGMLIIMFGFGWLWAGIKNINPVTLVKDVIGG